MSLWARESASRTAKPISRSKAATALLPLAIPPVRPSRSISLRLSRASGRLRRRKFGRGAAEAGGFHGIAHKHSDGHGADATGNGCECTGSIDCIRMDVADERAAFNAEFGEAVWEILEETLGFVGISDAVGANVDGGGAGFTRRGGLDPVSLHVCGFAHGGDDDVGAAENIGEVARFG